MQVSLSIMLQLSIPPPAAVHHPLMLLSSVTILAEVGTSIPAFLKGWNEAIALLSPGPGDSALIAELAPLPLQVARKGPGPSGTQVSSVPPGAG